LRVGALVLCQSYRNPALLAKMAANLQLLSGES
jgi:alkanesulfonate monooxygenase SsuD/methylene tetrahydromethanopterin reductase-like flavin-dependent oxidoreductase (luciferase family)